MESDQNQKLSSSKWETVDISGFSAVSCPYLGSKSDQLTRAAFPSTRNRCYRQQPALERQIQFQRTFCLSANHEQCTIFQEADLLQIAVPNAGEEPTKNGRRNLALSLIVALITFIALISLVAMGSSLMTAVSAFALR